MPYDQGTQPTPQPQYPQASMTGYEMPPQQMGMAYGAAPIIGYPAKNGIAMASMVTGIVAQVLVVLFFLTNFMVPLSPAAESLIGLVALTVPVIGMVAFILGVVGMSKAKSLMGAGRAKAITGIVCGLLAAVTMVGLFGLGLWAMTQESQEVSQQDPDGQAGQEGSGDQGNQSEPGGGSSGATEGNATGSPIGSGTPSDDGMTPEQLDAMLSGAIWECHASSGEIVAKFTFDSSNHSYSYWKGDADPVSKTGDRISGHYEAYFDEDAYAFLDGYNGTGYGMRKQAAGLSILRGEPVHYIVLMTTPESENISGVETPRTDSEAVMWDGVWETESRHMQIVNANTVNAYEVYDSTVPMEERETVMAEPIDMQEQLSSDEG